MEVLCFPSEGLKSASPLHLEEAQLSTGAESTTEHATPLTKAAAYNSVSNEDKRNTSSSSNEQQEKRNKNASMKVEPCATTLKHVNATMLVSAAKKRKAAELLQQRGKPQYTEPADTLYWMQCKKAKLLLEMRLLQQKDCLRDTKL